MITKAMISFCQRISNDDHRHVDTIQDFASSTFAQLSNHFLKVFLQPMN
jgi:hypothetical protein